MDLAYYIFQQTKLKPVFTSIMNIWASARTMKSKRIPRQRNDFIQEQKLHSWTGDLGSSFLTGLMCEPLQGGLLWAVYHHGHTLLYTRKCKCQATPQCSHILIALKSISSGQNHVLECLLKSFVCFFNGETVFIDGHGAVSLWQRK